MKTTNKFKYSFVMIGYIALLSLAQYAKAGSEVISIDTNPVSPSFNSFIITGSGLVGANSSVVSKDRFIVYCPYKQGYDVFPYILLTKQNTNPSFFNAVLNNGFDSIVASDFDGAIGRGRIISTKYFGGEFNISVLKEGIDIGAYTLQVACKSKLAGTNVAGTLDITPSLFTAGVTLDQNKAYLFQISNDATATQ
jgi:hypothetical protein